MSRKLIRFENFISQQSDETNLFEKAVRYVIEHFDYNYFNVNFIQQLHIVCSNMDFLTIYNYAHDKNVEDFIVSLAATRHRFRVIARTAYDINIPGYYDNPVPMNTPVQFFTKGGANFIVLDEDYYHIDLDVLQFAFSFQEDYAFINLSTLYEAAQSDLTTYITTILSMPSVAENLKFRIKDTIAVINVENDPTLSDRLSFHDEVKKAKTLMSQKVIGKNFIKMVNKLITANSALNNFDNYAETMGAFAAVVNESITQYLVLLGKLAIQEELDERQT